MIKPCFQHHAKRFASIALMMLAILLVGCMGDDPPDWHGTDISGVMPKLEFDLIDSQGTRVSGDDYSGQECCFSDLPLALMFAPLLCKNSARPSAG